jgi:hypothetical protein
VKHTSRGRSLHIGLNRVDSTKYVDDQGHGWHGLLSTCETDARDMAALAESVGTVPATLLGADATAARILRAFRSATRASSAGDFFLLSFSGHGGRMPDLTGDESDRVDETWVTYDRQLLDDEIFLELSRFAAGVRVLIVSDSCFSGTIAQVPPPPPSDESSSLHRAARPMVTKALPPSVRTAEPEGRASLYRRIQRSVPPAAQSQEKIVASILQFGAAQDGQPAGVGTTHSIYTGYFLQTWDQGRFQGDYRAFFDAIAECMPSDQTPNWFVPGPEDPAFVSQRPFTI